MTFEFQNTLFRSHHHMIAALATEWWTCGGINTPEEIEQVGCSADGLEEADDAIVGWELDQPIEHAFTGEVGPSWMERTNTSREMLAEALLDFWVTHAAWRRNK